MRAPEVGSGWRGRGCSRNGRSDNLGNLTGVARVPTERQDPRPVRMAHFTEDKQNDPLVLTQDKQNDPLSCSLHELRHQVDDQQH